MKQKILHILTNLNNGNIQNDTINLCNHFPVKDFDVYLCAKNGTKRKSLRPNIKYIELYTSYKNPLKTLISIYKIRKLIKTEKITTVHFHEEIVAPIVYWATKNLEIQTVYTDHILKNRKGFLRTIYTQYALSAKKIICVSSYGLEYLNTHYFVKEQDKISIINKGIDLKQFSSENITTPMLEKITTQIGLYNYLDRIIFIPTEISRYSNHINIIEAIRQLITDNEVKDVLFIFSGNFKKDKIYNTIINKIKTYNLEEHIRMQPETSDIKTMYAISYAIISAWTSPKAFGKVVIESFAFGKPVLGSNIGEIKNKIHHEVNGFLTNPSSPNEIRLYLQKLLDLKSKEYRAMCEQALDFSKKFSIEKTIKDTINLYNAT